MNPWRRLPPVHSPIDLAAIVAALGREDLRPELETALCADFGARTAVLTESGTGALTLALRSARALRPGGFVALPAYGCFDLATAAIGAEAPVMLYDIDPETFAPERASLERLLGAQCAAVVLVHHYGIPAPIDTWAPIVAASGARLIEDAAQAIGGSLQGRRLGAIGPVSILSFGRGKGMTGGSGGAMLVRDEAIRGADDIRSGLPSARPRGHAIKLAAQWLLSRPSLYGIPSAIPSLQLGATLYHPPQDVCGILPAAARTVLHTRRLVDAEAAIRFANAERFGRALQASTTLRAPQVRGRPGWLRYPALARDARSPSARTEQMGVRPGYPIALSHLDPLRRSLREPCHSPGAHDLASRLWTLPTHSLLSENDLAHLERWIRGD